MQSLSSSQSMDAIPTVGGRVSSIGGELGATRVPTPRELHRMLDDYVVGQDHAKKVCILATHHLPPHVSLLYMRGHVS